MVQCDCFSGCEYLLGSENAPKIIKCVFKIKNSSFVTMASYPTVNPSYVTNEVTFESCPYVSATSSSVLKWTKNVPRYHGDSVLGIYGGDYDRFVGKSQQCFNCDRCEENTTTPLFYRPPRSIVFPTYAFEYRGKDSYYRVPY